MLRIGVVAAGELEVLAARRATADEHRVVPLAEQRSHALHPRRVPNVHPHVDDHRDLLVEHLGREPEGGDVGAHQATGLVLPLDDHDLVPERHQIVGHRQ